MAQKVFVKNDNVYPLREIFKGEEITIDSGDFWRDKKGNKREVDIFEANDFRGQYHPVPIDGSGQMLKDDPKYHKKISMHPVNDVTLVQAPTFKCMAPDCAHVSPSPEELEAHTNVRHASIDKLILPEEDAEIVHKKQVGKR